MSLFLFPSGVQQQAPQPHTHFRQHAGRCVPVQPHHHHHLHHHHQQRAPTHGPRDLFSVFPSFESDDEDGNDEVMHARPNHYYALAAAREQHARRAERQRRLQQQQEAIQHQQRAQLEREMAVRHQWQQLREAGERRRHQQQQQEALMAATAAATAFATFQQQAELQQREAERARHIAIARRQQWEQEQEQLRQRRQFQVNEARKAVYIRHKGSLQERQRQRVAWESEAGEAATQGFATLMDFAQHFFGAVQSAVEGTDDNNADVEMGAPRADPQTNTTHNVETSSTKHEEGLRSVPIENAQTPVEPAITDDAEMGGPSHESEAAAAGSEPQEEATTSRDVASEDNCASLVFTYPLPADEAARVSLKASDIRMTFDGPTKTVRIDGLWEQQQQQKQDPASSTSDTVVASDDEEATRGRKRSRSPKRSRVADVDETTGEEIEQPDSGGDYVDLGSTTSAESHGTATPAAAETSAPASVSFPLPTGADVTRLRADLTDEGLQIWA